MNNNLQDWRGAYQNITEYLATEIEEIKHFDLYYGQEQAIDEDGNWIPFRCPAVFLDFNVVDIKELSEKRQLLTVDVGVYFAYETVQDSHRGSPGQSRALTFIAFLRQIHSKLHGRMSTHHGPMTRVSYIRVDAPPAMIMYNQTYRCVMLDYGATDNFNEIAAPPLEIGGVVPPVVPDPDPLFPGMAAVLGQ